VESRSVPENSSNTLARLYATRFTEEQRSAKARLWEVLVDRFLQRYIPPDSTVVDIAGGYGEFASHVNAKRKIIVDLNPDAGSFANAGIEVRMVDARKLGDQADLAAVADVVFVSNFFEHLASKDDLLAVLAGIRTILRPGGTLLVIQPNFRYAVREYFDFLDHTLVITDRSLAEALQLAGFTIEELIPRFLPFTTKGRPSSALLLRIYLSLRWMWPIFGAQIFARATKPLRPAD
jgi:SAM-dependent methyltransferase